MADSIFDRTIINTRERPLSSDINQLASQFDRTVREVFEQLLGRPSGVAGDPSVGTAFASASGFIGEAFMARSYSPASLNVRLPKGIGFINDPASVPTAIGGALSLDDRSSYKPIVLTQDVNVSVPPNVSGNARRDIIEVRYNRAAGNPSSRDVLNISTGRFEPQSVNKTLSWVVDGLLSYGGALAINYKVGTPTGGAVTETNPPEPATTAGYVKIASILVPNGAAVITQDQIVDYRQMLAPGGMVRAAARFRTAAGVYTNFQAWAPPGVRIGVLHSGLASFGVAIIAGGAPRGCVVSGTAYESGGLPCIVGIGGASALAPFVAASGDVGLFNGGSMQWVLDMALGQTYMGSASGLIRTHAGIAPVAATDTHLTFDIAL